MAIAKVETEIVEELVTVEKEVNVYHLELTAEEMEVILVLTGNVFGSPKTSPRGIADGIYNAIDALELPQVVRKKWVLSESVQFKTPSY